MSQIPLTFLRSISGYGDTGYGTTGYFSNIVIAGDATIAGEEIATKSYVAGQVLSGSTGLVGIQGVTGPTGPVAALNTVDTSSTRTGKTFYPVFVGSTGTGQTAYIDSTVGPLTYNPDSGLLTVASLSVGSTATFSNGLNASLMTNLSSLTTSGAVIFNSVIRTNGACELLGVAGTTIAGGPLTCNSVATFNNGLIMGSGSLQARAFSASNGLLVSGGTVAISVPTTLTTLSVGSTASVSGMLYANGGITGTTFTGALLGNASSASTVALTANDNTDGTYFIPFSKSFGATSNALFIDNILGPLTYNPSTSVLTALIFNGATQKKAQIVSSGSTAINFALGSLIIDDNNTTTATAYTLPALTAASNGFEFTVQKTALGKHDTVLSPGTENSFATSINDNTTTTSFIIADNILQQSFRFIHPTWYPF